MQKLMQKLSFDGIKFEPRDLWIGVYWERAGRITTLETDIERYRVYVCVVPCLPCIFVWQRRVKPYHREW